MSQSKATLLLQLLGNSDEFVSGQYISEQLGISRTAIWKYIEQLREEGYQFEAVRRKGYRLLQKPDKISAEEIIPGLTTKALGHVIHHFDTIGSTQKFAHQLANDGTPHGTVVIAEEQTTGRGRMDRSWHSPSHEGIAMSMVLRPPLIPQRTPQLTLLAAVAVCQAVTALVDVKVDIKWPNDLLVGGKKFVGILTELQADMDRVHAVIIGIGINVNQRQFTPEIADIATSIALESGTSLERSRLIQEVFARFEQLYDLYLEQGFYPIKLLWESYSISIGRHITARTWNETIVGVAEGITDEGVLLLRDESGTVHSIHSADIELND